MVNDLNAIAAAQNQPEVSSSSLVTTETTCPHTVYIINNKKGGSGKTETAECLEAISTMSSQRCLLVDVDDGNRGLGRRVGLDRVVKVSWDAEVTAAPQWVSRYAVGVDTMIFDLGAGIDSSDLPITAYLSSIWRMLKDRGARIIICAVASTNAPTARYVERLAERFGSIGEMLVVCNNQDGSGEFTPELAELARPTVHLGRVQSGVQTVRLRRRELLSTVVRNPESNYKLAVAYMALRLYAFARQDFFRDLISRNAVKELEHIAAKAPRHRHFVINRLAVANDEMIEQNARVGQADNALRLPDLNDADILGAAKTYRLEHARYLEKARQATKL